MGIASQPFTILARDCSGVIWRSRDDGSAWQQAGNCSGRSGFLSVIPGSALLMAAGSSVCKSTDLGSTWTDFPTRATGGLNAVGYTPAGTGSIFALSSSGILRSTNGGASFSPANDGLSATSIAQVLIDKDSSRTLYAAIYTGGNPSDQRLLRSSSGVYRSRDAGKTWTLLSNISAMRQAFEVALDPFDPTIQYAATSSAVYKSADDGKTWAVTAQTGLMRAVLPDPATPGSVYAGRGYSVGGGGGVFASSNQGAAWSQIGTGFTVEKLAISADGLTLCAATSGSGVKCSVASPRGAARPSHGGEE